MYRRDIVNIHKVFPYKFEECTQSGNLSHSQSLSAAFTINSDLQILDQTWLAAPPADKLTGGDGDWTSFNKLFPSHRYGNTVMPKDARAEHGDPPFQFTFKYSDARTQSFFSSDPWLKDGKIRLPHCFESGSTYGGHHVSKLALNEGLAKRALQSAHGIFDFNSDMEHIVGELESRDPSTVDWKDLIVQFQILLNLNLKALRRIILYTSSSVMVSKHMARELVLSRFSAKPTLKEACLFSDFGTPELFGPLCADMAENVRMYRTHDTKEWLLTTSKSLPAWKRKASSSPSPSPYKKPAKVSASPLAASSFTPPAPKPGQKKQFSKGVFWGARGKSGKKWRGGRGGKGS